MPEIASRFHVEYIMEVFFKALKASGKNLNEIKLISVTKGPGLVGALLTGISMAKALGYCLRVPIIGVNHVLAHLYSPFLGPRDIKFPFVGLVVSGGHTAIYYCEDMGRQKLLGNTQDDAVGEAYDKVAKLLGLGYPGGPEVEKAAGCALKKEGIRFPRSYLGKGSLDFSFSGVKTAVLYYAREKGSGFRVQGSGKKLSGEMVNDICYAFQEAVLDVLVDKTILAARIKGVNTIVIGGGVAINSRLREKFNLACAFSKCKVYFPERQYCMDNAAMVGVLGEASYRKGTRSNLYMTAEPNL